MHRMRRFVILAGAVFVGHALAITSASAALLKPDAKRTYPDVAADINGVISYTYSSATNSGNFHLTNTPYLIASGPTSAEEFAITADSGIRRQTLNVTLDTTGNVVGGPTNVYELYGAVNVNGQIFSGTLLTGTPTKFGSQDLSAVGVEDSDLFDLEIQVTGGALADYFGETAYMRITPELASTFKGRFDEDFGASKATSNTRRNGPAQPFPIPEPATVLIVLAGGFGLVHRHRARARRGD